MNLLISDRYLLVIITVFPLTTLLFPQHLTCHEERRNSSHHQRKINQYIYYNLQNSVYNIPIYFARETWDWNSHAIISQYFMGHLGLQGSGVIVQTNS